MKGIRYSEQIKIYIRYVRLKVFLLLCLSIALVNSQFYGCFDPSNRLFYKKRSCKFHILCTHFLKESQKSVTPILSYNFTSMKMLPIYKFQFPSRKKIIVIYRVKCGIIVFNAEKVSYIKYRRKHFGL